VVDSWLHIPYPEWYQEYFMLHLDPLAGKEPFTGAYAAALAKSGGKAGQVRTGSEECLFMCRV
jgi:hypothetical protein